MRLRPTEVRPTVPNPVLPNADWADAFEMKTDREFEDMRTVVNRIFSTMPRWSKQLLWLRNVLVAPFGLKSGAPTPLNEPAKQIGFFSVLSEETSQIVLGVDDQHLDFRILLERHSSQSGVYYRLTTLIKRHNFFGRMYLFLIAPFHKLIVRSAMQNAL